MAGNREKKSYGNKGKRSSEGRGLGHTGGDGNLDVGREGRPFSPSKNGTGKYMDSNISRGKVVSNTGGPEDEPRKKKTGQWSTQASRYASGS